MPIVTINGQVGSGTLEIGAELARQLGADYVDRLILAEAGKRVGATVAALVEKETRSPTLRERLGRLTERALARSAVAGGDPFFGHGVEALLTHPFPEGTHEPITRAHELDDLHFVQVLDEVIRELAAGNNAVIVGRASNMTLKEWPGALHVGLAAPWEFRVAIMMRRENIDRAAAERMIKEQSKAREVFFRRFFKVFPSDPSAYHIMLNTGRMGIEKSVEVIRAALSSLQK